MRDVRKRTAVHECGIVFQRLHQVWLHRVFQQHSHGTVRFDIPAINRATVTAIGNDDVAQTGLQIVQVPGQTQDGHDLGRDRNIKACFTGETVGNTTQ